MNWLKLSASSLLWQRKLSQKQIDFIFDYMEINNYESQINLFMECSCQQHGYFKIKGDFKNEK